MTTEEDKIKVEGVVVEALPRAWFRVRLDNGHEVLAYLSSKSRKSNIRIMLGDRVVMEISPSDATRARIKFRQSNKASSAVEKSSVDQLAGDSTTNAPPPEKKKRKGK